MTILYLYVCLLTINYFGVFVIFFLCRKSSNIILCFYKNLKNKKKITSVGISFMHQFFFRFFNISFISFFGSLCPYEGEFRSLKIEHCDINFFSTKGRSIIVIFEKLVLLGDLIAYASCGLGL